MSSAIFQEASTSETVNIGIVGVGNMGAAHARSILKGEVARCRLTAICDTDSEKLSRFSEYESVAKYKDIDALIAAGNVDALVIATPHPNHITSGEKSLTSGLHTLIEKPLCTKISDCTRLINTHRAAAKDLVFAEMFNQRTNPAYKKLREMIQTGELGHIHRISWTITNWFRTQAYYKSSPWRASWAGEGGGVVINQGSHQLDLWQWLFGIPDSIYAHALFGARHDIKTPDDLTAILAYNSGTTGTFVISSGESKGVNRLELGTDSGCLAITDTSIIFDKLEVSLREFIDTSPHGYSHPQSERVEYNFENTGPQHVGILQNYVDTILGREELISPAYEGRTAVELQNAMVYAASSGKTVELPLDEATYSEFLDEMIQSERA